MNCSRRASSKGFRRAVLKFLVREHALSEELRRRMLGWRYSGFSVHNQVCVAAEDVEGRKKLAGYMLRAPMSLEKMTYDAASGTVIQGGEGGPPFPRLEDAPGPEEELPGDARGAVARVALPAHPGSLRAPGALRRLVLEPGAGRAGQGAQGSACADNMHCTH